MTSCTLPASVVKLTTASPDQQFIKTDSGAPDGTQFFIDSLTSGPVGKQFFTKTTWSSATPVITPLMYRNKQYPSASAALDAYINDYEGSFSAQRSLTDVDRLLVPGLFGRDDDNDNRRDLLHARKMVALQSVIDQSYRKTEERNRAQSTYRNKSEFICLGAEISGALSDSFRVLDTVGKDKLPSPTQSDVTQVTASHRTDVRSSDFSTRGSTSTELQKYIEKYLTKDTSVNAQLRHLNSGSRNSTNAKYSTSTSQSSAFIGNAKTNGVNISSHLGSNSTSNLASRNATNSAYIGDSSLYNSTSGLYNSTSGSKPAVTASLLDSMEKQRRIKAQLDAILGKSKLSISEQQGDIGHHGDTKSQFTNVPQSLKLSGAVTQAQYKSESQANTDNHRDIHAQHKSVNTSPKLQTKTVSSATGARQTNSISDSVPPKVDGKMSSIGRGKTGANVVRKPNSAGRGKRGPGVFNTKQLIELKSKINAQKSQTQAQVSVPVSVSSSKVLNLEDLCDDDETTINKGPPSWVAELEGSEVSSIISGNLHDIKAKTQGKVASTPVKSPPKRSPSKQLRFDLDSLRSSDQGLTLNDLDSSANLLARKPPASILKRAVDSDIKSARASVVTDDLVDADPKGRSNNNSSRNYGNAKEFANIHSILQYSKNPFMTTIDSTLPLDSTVSTYKDYSGIDLPSFKGYPEDVSIREAPVVPIPNTKHRDYLVGLMDDIEDSPSSVVTAADVVSDILGQQRESDQAGGVSTATTSKYDIVNDVLGKDMTTAHASKYDGTAGDDGGFLSRIRHLLSDPPSGDTETNDAETSSVNTDLVLEGDRPWEATPSFKPPKYVTNGDGHHVDTTEKANVIEDFLKSCGVGSDQAADPSATLTGTEHPGGLETLKHMLFAMQSFTGGQEEMPDSVDVSAIQSMSFDNELLSPESKRLLSESFSQHGGEGALEMAMEHLNKLQNLVRKRPNKDDP